MLNILDDGDALNFTLLLDNMMAEEALRMQPHFSIPDVNKPYAVSGLLTLLSPSTSILTNFLYDSRKSDKQDTCIDKFNFVDITD